MPQHHHYDVRDREEIGQAQQAAGRPPVLGSCPFGACALMLLKRCELYEVGVLLRS